MKAFPFLFILAGVLIFASCSKEQIINGRAELVSQEDSLLNDSAIIFGYVHQVDWTHPTTDEGEFEITLTDTLTLQTISTTNSGSGYYSFKVAPADYSIDCQKTTNTHEQLRESINELEISANEITQVDFYIGYSVE